ncbi:MAG: hypothetical protein IRY98_07945 [Alicyclobacillaceae bacterium]|nr:hypothetical protein [Alicyclobacillaceae bacterium]
MRILEVKWQGGTPVVWGELPLAMPSRIDGIRTTPGKIEPPGPPIWGVDGVYPAPGGRGIAVAVRDAPDAGRSRVRGLAGLTGRSAAPLWLTPPRPGPLMAAGWAEQNGRPWFAFLTGSTEDRTRGSAPRSILCAWSPGGSGREAAGVVRILTPKGAEDTFATPHTRRNGWMVSRSLERTWTPRGFGPRAMWVVRPDGRAVRVSRPPFGKEDVAGWWGPDEQWLWLRVGGTGAQLWWWPRRSGEDGEPCLDDIPPEAAAQPNVVEVQFVRTETPKSETTKER